MKVRRANSLFFYFLHTSGGLFPFFLLTALVIIQPDGWVCDCGDSSPHGSESGDKSPHSTFGGLNDDQGPFNLVALPLGAYL